MCYKCILVIRDMWQMRTDYFYTNCLVDMVLNKNNETFSYEYKCGRFCKIVCYTLFKSYSFELLDFFNFLFLVNVIK